MANVSIKFDERALKNVFGDELKKQINYATSLTLNNAAFDARSSAQTMLRRRLEIKKSFLPSSIVVDKANKNHLVATVGFLERARLAPLLEEGGERHPFGKFIAIPVNAKTRAGRVTNARRPKALIAKGAFAKTINGTIGIWMTVGRGRNAKLSLMYLLKDKTHYDSGTIRFRRTVEGVVPQSFKKHFGKNLENALASRKR